MGKLLDTTIVEYCYLSRMTILPNQPFNTTEEYSEDEVYEYYEDGVKKTASRSITKTRPIIKYRAVILYEYELKDENYNLIGTISKSVKMENSSKNKLGIEEFLPEVLDINRNSMEVLLTKNEKSGFTGE